VPARYARAVPFLVRLRPNAAYLALLGIGVALLGLGTTMDGPFRFLLIGCGVVFVVILGTPILLSTVLRVPILAVDDAGVRLPLMGVRLGWAEIVRVRQAIGVAPPVLLIVPADQQAVMSQMRPWIRSESRTNIARYGTPIVVPQQTADRTLEDIEAAIAHHASQARNSRTSHPPDRGGTQTGEQNAGHA